MIDSGKFLRKLDKVPQNGLNIIQRFSLCIDHSIPFTPNLISSQSGGAQRFGNQVCSKSRKLQICWNTAE